MWAESVWVYEYASALFLQVNRSENLAVPLAGGLMSILKAQTAKKSSQMKIRLVCYLQFLGKLTPLKN